MIAKLVVFGIFFSSYLFAGVCPLANGEYKAHQAPFAEAYIDAKPDLGGCKIHLEIGAEHWHFVSNNPSEWDLGWVKIDIKSNKEFYMDVFWEGPKHVRYTLMESPHPPSPKFKSSSELWRIQQHYQSLVVDLVDRLIAKYEPGEIFFRIQGKPHEYFDIENNERIVYRRPLSFTGIKVPFAQFRYDIQACLKSRPKDCDSFELRFVIDNIRLECLAERNVGRIGDNQKRPRKCPHKLGAVPDSQKRCKPLLVRYQVVE